MMNNRGHLPAGQPMQGGVADGMVPAPGSNSGGGRRGGRPHQPYPTTNGHHYHHSVGQPMYPPGYMAPYGAAPAAPYYNIPPHYQNGAIPAPAYLPYPPTGYTRSPPSMQHYVPMVPQNPYARAPQSPVVPAPYQAPHPVQHPVHIPIPPHTPSSTHSQVGLPPPMSTVAQTQTHAAPPQQPPVEPQPDVQPDLSLPPRPPAPSKEAQGPPTPPGEPEVETVPIRFVPLFRPPLPWLSHDDFPKRTPKSRRRKRAPVNGLYPLPPPTDASSVTVGREEAIVEEEQIKEAEPETEQEHIEEEPVATTPKEPVATEPKEHTITGFKEPVVTTPKVSKTTPADEVTPRSDTPSTQDQPLEDSPSTSPSTPSSVHPSINVASKPVKPATRSGISGPVIPVVPALPKSSPKDAKTAKSAQQSPKDTQPATSAQKTKVVSQKDAQPTSSVENTQPEAKVASDPAEKEPTGDDQVSQTPEVQPSGTQPAPGPGKPQPKSWASLLTPATPGGKPANNAPAAQPHINGNAAAATVGAGGFAQLNSSSVAQVLNEFRVDGSEKIAFLEPRGLVNNGNTCYMNSVLQVLISCVPFYHFLDQVKKKAVHSFKSETPLLDALVMLLDEFKVIHSAVSVEQLSTALKTEHLEQFGEAFSPQLVYETIRGLPRFADMKQGSQQDAQEFLGLLLEELHDECAHVMRAAPGFTASTSTDSALSSPTEAHGSGEKEWSLVVSKQRTAVTRNSGYSTILSPITKIFGGQTQSTVSIPSSKPSVTFEPFQSLQLDIGDDEVRTLADALTRLASMEELVDSDGIKKDKQTQIKSLPPVLILHLKRFQFEPARKSTVKIEKKVSFPLELEVPRRILTPRGRESLPITYRLIGVIYHHGRAANTGHYTVDLRRQDGQEWIHIDDTVIRRVRSEDVAEATPEASKTANNGPGGPAANRYAGINNGGWETAKGKTSKQRQNKAASGSGSAQNANQPKSSNKDQVPYLLFYQLI